MDTRVVMAGAGAAQQGRQDPNLDGAVPPSPVAISTIGDIMLIALSATSRRRRHHAPRSEEHIRARAKALKGLAVALTPAADALTAQAQAKLVLAIVEEKTGVILAQSTPAGVEAPGIEPDGRIQMLDSPLAHRVEKLATITAYSADCEKFLADHRHRLIQMVESPLGQWDEGMDASIEYLAKVEKNAFELGERFANFIGRAHFESPAVQEVSDAKRRRRSPSVEEVD